MVVHSILGLFVCLFVCFFGGKSEQISFYFIYSFIYLFFVVVKSGTSQLCGLEFLIHNSKVTFEKIFSLLLWCVR